MPERDLRGFIDLLSDHGELRVVDGADWELEIGTISELNYERQGPALLFDNIKGYPSGYRLVTNAVDTLKKALVALDFPLDLSLEEASQALEKKRHDFKPVPAIEVSEAPILENAYFGDDVDLLKFPTPRWHDGDGGRYLGTGCSVILRDPESSALTMGCYRLMIHDRNTLGLYISPPHLGSIIRKKYWARGEACPVAVSFGHDPLMFLAAAANLGKRSVAKDYEFIGHFLNSPMQTVRDEITGLPIPAMGEIVVTGEIPPPEEEVRPEGPFGEWTGYYASGTRDVPVVRVKALYHRDYPIILGAPPVKFRHSTSHFGIPHHPLNEVERLRAAGVDDVLDVWRIANPGVMVVQIRQRYPGHAMKAGLALAGEYMGRFVVVVDEDINPRDSEDVLWAIGTRCDPETTLTLIKGCQSSALDPRIPPEQKARGDFTTSRAIINACKPYEWKDQFPQTNTSTPELRKATLAKWKHVFNGSTS